MASAAKTEPLAIQKKFRSDNEKCKKQADIYFTKHTELMNDCNFNGW
jgi:hypothetical protein